MKHHLSIVIALPLLITACTTSAPDDVAPSRRQGRTAGQGTDVAIEKGQASATERVLEHALYYYDGSTKRTLWLDGQRIAEFSPTEQSRTTLLAYAENAKDLRVGLTTVRVWSVDELPDADGFTRSLNAGDDTQPFSPVLREGRADTSGMRALPGGVILVLDPEWTHEQAVGWIRARGQTIERTLTHVANAYLLSTPAGLESLEVANRLYETRAVVSAHPNWWREVGTR